jgi:hypothetical protein
LEDIDFLGGDIDFLGGYMGKNIGVCLKKQAYVIKKTSMQHHPQAVAILTQDSVF